MANLRQFSLGVLLLIGILANSIKSGSSMHVHDHEDEAPSAKYKRDPYAVLARFSSDERTVRSRNRRQTLTIDSDLQLYNEVETLSGDVQSGELDELTKAVEEAKIALATIKLCCYQEPLQLECPYKKYRRYDGQCNNLFKRRWGSVDQPTPRLLPANYKDGISTPAEFTVTAREVSRKFVTHEAILDEYKSNELIMHFGQFLDHDLALTPHLSDDCGYVPTAECLPISCADDDPLCGNSSSIKFSRSRPALEERACIQVYPPVVHARTHPNAITSFVDASNVYGSLQVTNSQLRTFKRGLLILQEGVDPNNQEHIHLLPDDEVNKECDVGADEKKCGKGGDIRAAEQPGLTSLHTLFVNEHNRIAKQLYLMHGCWPDELLFQETRRIVIAIMQKIVYGEWLPLVIGQEAMEKYELGLWHPFKGYDGTINPTTFNEFGAAFFRFGHSMAPEELKRVKPTWDDTHDDINLTETFFNASIVHDQGNGGMNSILLGMLMKQLLAIDRHISASIHEHLFANIDFGLDLIALNIQRGRDHGVRPYIDYRQHCGLGTTGSFSDLEGVMADDALKALKGIYSSVKEIEPFVGMLAEKHVPGGLVGPTLACVIGKQFHNLKYGDRYWFENNQFTPGQLEAIKKVTMSRVICDTVYVHEIQPAAFKLHEDAAKSESPPYYEMINTQAFPNKEGRLNSFVNSRVSCYDYGAIPPLDLSEWEADVKQEPEIFYNYEQELFLDPLTVFNVV